MMGGWLFLKTLKLAEEAGVDDGGARVGIACAADRFYEKNFGGAVDAIKHGFKYGGVPMPRAKRPSEGNEPQQMTI